MTTKPTGKLKIFDGCGYVNGQTGQKNLFVAATSRKSAVEALHAHGVFESAGRLATHWSTLAYEEGTHNAKHYARAMAEPGQVFCSPYGLQSDKKYDPLPKLDLDASNTEKREAVAKKRPRSPSL